MSIRFRKIFIAFLVFCFLTTLSSCFKDASKVSIIYQNDFEMMDMKSIVATGFPHGNFGQFTDIKIIDYNGTKVLGRFNNARIDLVLNQLPKHQAISVQFDLYIHDKWSNDPWVMELNGARVLVTGFSNFDAIQQAYPNWIGNGSDNNPAGANSYNRNLPGACSLATQKNGTSLYKMEQTFLHTDPTFLFGCSDAGSYFNLNCERSWSIDNLKITLINNQ